MFENNVFGLAAMTRAVLPSMRAQKSGAIVNISSQGGFIGFAGVGYYNATKFAVEGLSEALAKEVAPFGIKVLIVEPGPFRTDWGGRSLKAPKQPIEAYAETAIARRKTDPELQRNPAGRSGPRRRGDHRDGRERQPAAPPAARQHRLRRHERRDRGGARRKSPRSRRSPAAADPTRRPGWPVSAEHRKTHLAHDRLLDRVRARTGENSDRSAATGSLRPRATPRRYADLVTGPWPSVLAQKLRRRQAGGRSRPSSRRRTEKFGRVDVLVNNAGYGYLAAIEEGEDADKIRAMFETNFFGLAALTRAVLPLYAGAEIRARSSIFPRWAGSSATPAPAITQRPSSPSRACRRRSPRRSRHTGSRCLIVKPGPFRTDWEQPVAEDAQAYRTQPTPRPPSPAATRSRATAASSRATRSAAPRRSSRP